MEPKPQETAERAAPIPATATPGSISAAVEAAETGDQRMGKR